MHNHTQSHTNAHTTRSKGHSADQPKPRPFLLPVLGHHESQERYWQMVAQPPIGPPTTVSPATWPHLLSTRVDLRVQGQSRSTMAMLLLPRHSHGHWHLSRDNDLLPVVTSHETAGPGDSPPSSPATKETDPSMSVRCSRLKEVRGSQNLCSSLIYWGPPD